VQYLFLISFCSLVVSVIVLMFNAQIINSICLSGVAGTSFFNFSMPLFTIAAANHLINQRIYLYVKHDSLKSMKFQTSKIEAQLFLNKSGNFYLIFHVGNILTLVPVKVHVPFNPGFSGSYHTCFISFNLKPSIMRKRFTLLSIAAPLAMLK
jgi:hypothetical protein